MTVWLNGALLSAATARIDPTDRGFTLGDGVFETIGVTGGRACHLSRHLLRLRGGLAVLGMTLAWSDAALEAAVEEILAANGLTEAAIRLTVSRGPAPRGVLPPPASDPTVLMTAGPLPKTATPARAMICAVTRRNEFSPLSRIKSLNYLDAILARQEAAERGADEALLLNTQGVLAEASAANLFVLKDGVLMTPPASDGALPGVARALLIENCGAAEVRMHASDLFAAEAVFLSNALGLREVVVLDDRPLGRRPDVLANIGGKLARLRA